MKNVIIFSSIDWDFIWQGHQEIATRLARSGCRVLFIENTGVRMPTLRDLPRLKSRVRNFTKGVRGIRREEPNLYIYSPLVLPFPYSRIAKVFNHWIFLATLKKWQNLMNFDAPVIWSFLPTDLTLDAIEHLQGKLLIYYCIDNFSQSSKSAGKVTRAEDKFIEQSNLVFVTSRALALRCQEFNRKVHNFPFVVNLDDFKIDSSQKHDIADLPQDKPVVGYIGGVHQWIDFGLVKELAGRNSQFNFVFIGPVQVDISCFKDIENVHFLGAKPHKELAPYLDKFDVAIIPYRLTEYTKNVYPTKLNEYFALGKPVVSTCLPEIDYFNQENNNPVLIANNNDEFNHYLAQAIADDNDALKLRRREIAGNNTWDKHIVKMKELINQVIVDKETNYEVSWREQLGNIYRYSRKRMVRFVGLGLIAYLVVFCSPAPWFLAAPLKINDQPRKTDVIIVFGGGVGESGQAGQGYEERVARAVDLYQAGYAEKVIFSSGYAWKYREPQLMKLLAVSMGIKGNDILLEQKSKNTYENVLNVSKLMRKNNLNSALLVSSPYHMRRAVMVFKKTSPDITVYYIPIIESIFYKHKYNASPKQIKAILHEYLSILYYLFKGYI